MEVLGERRLGADLDAVLEDLASWGTEVVLLETGAPDSGGCCSAVLISTYVRRRRRHRDSSRWSCHHHHGQGEMIRTITRAQTSTIHQVELNPMRSERRRGSGRRWYQRRSLSSVVVGMRSSETLIAPATRRARRMPWSFPWLGNPWCLYG
jgi:hypothetical protein